MHFPQTWERSLAGPAPLPSARLQAPLAPISDLRDALTQQPRTRQNPHISEHLSSRLCVAAFLSDPRLSPHHQTPASCTFPLFQPPCLTPRPPELPRPWAPVLPSSLTPQPPAWEPTVQFGLLCSKPALLLLCLSWEGPEASRLPCPASPFSAPNKKDSFLPVLFTGSWASPGLLKGISFPFSNPNDLPRPGPTPPLPGSLSRLPASRGPWLTPFPSAPDLAPHRS